MKISQEKLPDSQISLEIEIPAEASGNAYEEMVRNLASSSNIPGFRKGKVPRQILLQRIGKQRIKAAALEELIQKPSLRRSSRKRLMPSATTIYAPILRYY